MGKALERLIDYILDENEGLKKEIGRILSERDEYRASQAKEIEGLRLLVADYEQLKAAVLAPAPQNVAPAQEPTFASILAAEMAAGTATFGQPELDEDQPSELTEQNATRAWTKGNAPKEAWPLLVSAFFQAEGLATCPFCDKTSEQKRGRHQHMSRTHEAEYAAWRISPLNTAPGE